MSAPAVETVIVNGSPCRVWRKGKGPKLGVLPGLGGYLTWTPFLERLAETREVVAPSPPGFPGSEGHDKLDSHLDWLLATRDLLVGAGLDGCDLVGVSAGGALAADVAAVWPQAVKRLVLLAPFGLFDEAEPSTDPWAQRPGSVGRLLCADPEAWKAMTTMPAGVEAVEWEIQQLCASEAAARFLWPVGDTRLARRLHRIVAPTLLLWGGADKVLPFGYAKRFADAIEGPTTIRRIEGAGHLADLDAPDATAGAVRDFLGG